MGFSCAARRSSIGVARTEKRNPATASNSLRRGDCDAKISSGTSQVYHSRHAKIEFPPTMEIMERAGRLIGKLKVSPGVTDPETRARNAWAMAAGKKIALKTRATNLVRGTLVVEVEDIVWQRQLNTLRHFLLRNLHQELGEALVT